MVGGWDGDGGRGGRSDVAGRGAVIRRSMRGIVMEGVVGSLAGRGGE